MQRTRRVGRDGLVGVASVKLKTVADVYAAIPSIACKGKCTQYCGVIPLYPVESEKIQSAGHPVPLADANLTCTSLEQGRCSIYSDRPLICRLFGVVPAMKCPHGCKPDRWLTPKQVQRLMLAMERLSSDREAVVNQGLLPSLMESAHARTPAV